MKNNLVYYEIVQKRTMDLFFPNKTRILTNLLFEWRWLKQVSALPLVWHHASKPGGIDCS